MAKIEIKNRYNGRVIFGGDYDTVLACILAAFASGEDLRGADLHRSDLRGAKLSGVDLRGADLEYASLIGADLSGADLSGASLYGADLRDSDLSGSDLCGTDLYHADLSGADLGEKPEDKLWFMQTRILAEGDLIGWKKCRDGVIVKLRIPEAAKRSHAFGRKCRAEYAEVVEVFGAEEGISRHDGKIRYRTGETVRAESFDTDWRNECASGIHFFITRIEAENY